MRRGAFSAGLLAFAVWGCAQRTDWIEGTLVTVDVSGVWRGVGSVARGARGEGEFEMTLTQRGAKVTGDGRYRATKLTFEGTVRGDVFSFVDSGKRLRGEATVTGDEMSGIGSSGISTQASEFKFTLTRQP